MAKENIVDLAAYRNQESAKKGNEQSRSISEELENAIELLIQRLREQSPQYSK